MRFRSWLALVLVCLAPVVAGAENPASWDIVELTTTGEDVNWMSPTTVTTGLAEYDWMFNVTKIEARTTILFIPTWIDITSILAGEGIPLSGGGTEPGLPFVLLDESVNESGTSADFLIQVDGTGRGRASITNVTFGSYSGINITGIRASLNFTVTGYPHGDYDRDLDVDEADYNLWLANYGSTTHLDADGNRDSIVNAADYVVWRDHQGQSAGAGSASAIPEPSRLAVLTVIGGAFGLWRSVKRFATSDFRMLR